jgi:peptidoglycan hydrolase-like protein with peptidoglycan-binding domain
MRRSVLSGLALGLGLLCTPVSADRAFAERRAALVIGNSAYQNAPLLPNPARDARAIADQFQKAGYEVSTAFNLGIVDFKRAVRNFEDSAANAEVAVIYYAGHGIEIHGINYLVPVDAKLASDRDADDEAVTLERLVATADGAKILKLIILDACRDNPFVRTMKVLRTAALRDIRSGLSPVKPTNGDTLIAYAAEAGSAAEDGVGDHSPFAAAVVNNLFIPGLDVRLAFGRIRDEVLKKTNNRQTPYVYGSLGGNNISVVPGPNDAVAVSDPIGAMRDYLLVEQINSKRAWETFLVQHPNGPLADRARKEIQKLSQAEATATSTEDKVASLEPPKLATPHDSSSEEQRAWDKIQNSGDANDFRDFLKRFPSSPLANKAQAHLDVLERAAQEKAAKAQADREAAQQAEAERQAEAKRQAQEAARQKAQQAAALAAVQQAAKAAEQARRQAEREAALKAEEEAHALAKQAAEAEAARKKADEEAARKQAEDAKKQAEQQAAAEQARLAAERAKQQAEAEAAKKQVEDAAKKQADAEAAKKQAEGAAKKQADADAAKKQAEDAKKQAEQQAAEQARLAAERAKQQAEAEAAKKQAEEAAKKQAEQEAALAAAKQAAQAAEGARLKAEREAQTRQDAACKSEQDRIDVLKTQGGKARDDLKQLQQSLTCERLRPIVTAALDRANALPDVNTPAQIRSAQQELTRLGCFSGDVNGNLSPATTSAVQHYESERGQPAESVDISDAFISELKTQSARVCPLVCPKGKVADGDHCIAAVAHQKDKEEPAAQTRVTHQKDEEEPAAHTRVTHQKDEEKPAARQKSKVESTPRRKDNEQPASRQQAKRERPVASPRVIQQATSSSGGYHSGGGGGGTAIGVGF